MSTVKFDENTINIEDTALDCKKDSQKKYISR